MINEIEKVINLEKLLLTFSEALELADLKLSGHQKRTAYISWEIAKKANLSEKRIWNLYIAALFHDVGAITPETKSQLFKNEITDTEEHCILGEKLYKSVPLLKKASKIIRNHHTSFSKLRKDINNEFILESQILNIADEIDRTIIRYNGPILNQSQKIIEEIKNHNNTLIHQNVIKYFLEASKTEAFWLNIISPQLERLLLEKGPNKKAKLNLEGINSIANFLCTLIDFRSPFTSTHSSGVAECGVAIAEKYNFSENKLLKIKIAGSLHDIGKLGVPTTILEKKKKLTNEEFAIIKEHPYNTHKILSRIDGLEQISEWAGFHHEKLDGTGYPFHLTKKTLPLESKILAVADTFTAIIEDRPYRKGMTETQVHNILNNMVQNKHLDKNIVKILLSNYKTIITRVKNKQQIAKEFYNKEFRN